MHPQREAGFIWLHTVLRRGSWFFIAGALLWTAAYFASAQTGLLSQRRADSILQSGARDSTSWNEDTGLQLQGLDAAWYNTAKGGYFRYGKAKVDAVLAASTSIGATGTAANTLFARQLLLLYRVTLDAKYYKAATVIRTQLADTCDALSPSPEKLCTAEPFLAEYASVFQEPQEFANITRGFEQWDRVAHWSSPKAEEANLKNTGIAWLAASLVDALPYYPQDHPGRVRLIAILSRIANTAAQHQNRSTGVFEKSPDASPHEPIASLQACLLVDALAKGARLGYLPAEDSKLAVKAWQTASKSYLSADSDSAPGPGSGALLVAPTELDLAPTATLARGQTVLLDAWYNSQQRKNAAGQTEYFHYKWSDKSDSGYALFGHLFQSYGATTDTLYSAPTRETLSKAQYYIIVSPDIPVKNPNPHYMTAQDAELIAAWVKEGGILILMENDPPNADLSHLNLLADKFGIHFDDVLHHHILGEHVEDGRMTVDGNGPLFHHPHTLYMKDTCAISLSGPAVALFRDRGDVVMASAKYGRGTVFASVDPWLYNEYTDGRKNPQIYDQFDNFAGGQELVQWLLQQRPH
jgi:unsaturated rhamnogalacturonyl hydrolase